MEESHLRRLFALACVRKSSSGGIARRDNGLKMRAKGGAIAPVRAKCQRKFGCRFGEGVLIVNLRFMEEAGGTRTGERVVAARRAR